jgi:putative DNA primase/helicase
MAVARHFIADRFEDNEQFLLRCWRGDWWQWQTTHWDEVDARDIREAAYRYTENAEYTDTTGKTPVTRRWEPNRWKMAHLLEALGACLHLSGRLHPPQWITGNGMLPAHELVSVANGLLHVPTRTLKTHDPAFFNTVAVPFAFDPRAAAPRWLAFLAELWSDDPESIAALQEFFGYVISARTDLHKILLLVGPTRAGKGVIARILKALVGEGNCAGPTLASLGTNFGLSPLIGKPLAIISDARLGKDTATSQIVERLLSVSGEDVLTIDRKFRDPWTGTLTTRLFVISNELPRFGDASGAIANRFVMLMLTTSWLGRENTALTGELLPELPGILNWALDGLERLRVAGRFTEPPSSRDAIIALQDLVSPIAAFVRDRCLRGPHEIPCAELYRAWKDWAAEMGHRVISVQSFGRDLRAVIPTLRMIRPRDGDDRVRHYHGVTLIEHAREPGQAG